MRIGEHEHNLLAAAHLHCLIGGQGDCGNF
jgi:hypothetical protein